MNWKNQNWLILRAVNYYIRCDDAAPEMYDIEIASDRKGFETRNFLARLDARNKLEYFAELSQPVDWPPPLYQRVMGLEDCRLFAWRGEAWCVATVGELSADGVRRMVLARIDGAGSPNPVFADWRMLDAPVTGRHEKNWMPFVDGRELRFIYTTDPSIIADSGGRIERVHPVRFAPCILRGGSQAIAFLNGWVAVAHEVGLNGFRPNYFHRFVWFDRAFKLKKISDCFHFTKPGIEFAAGLSRSTDGTSLIISFGVDDREAKLATIRADEVSGALGVRRPRFRGTESLP
jgi:hypothetical protein